MEPRGAPLLEGGEYIIGAGQRRCYVACTVNLSLLAIVFLPPAIGADCYFGGPVVGSVRVGVILLTCLALSRVLFRVNSKRDTES